jgi:PAS domain S-box-containing protein
MHDTLPPHATSRGHEALAIIAESIPDFLLMSDGDGLPVYQNRAWRAYTGLPAETRSLRVWEAIAHPEDIERLHATWQVALKDRVAFEIEYRCRRHDGAYRWFLCRTVPVQDAAGTVTCWVGMLTDVHQQKLLEAELDQSMRRRDEFLATLAHEIRNPLQAMRQALYVMEMPNVSGETSEKMRELIDRQLTLLTRFTDDFLDFNKVRWNTMSLVPANITLGALVEQLTTALRPILAERQHELTVSIDDPDCLLTVDPGRVTQALTNVLGNASKYSDPGGRVALRATCVDGQAVFEIQDWGHGIEPRRLTEIFDLFARAPEDGIRARDGFGIGLAVARHVAHLHGGVLEAFSEGTGKGSQFTLRIPLVTAPRR